MMTGSKSSSNATKTSVMYETRIAVAAVPLTVTIALIVIIFCSPIGKCNGWIGDKIGKTIRLSCLIFGTFLYICAEIMIEQYEDIVYAVYSIIKHVLSTLVHLFPLCALSITNDNNANESIGYHHEGIEWVTSLLTLPVLIFEIVGMALRCHYDQKKKGKIDGLYLAVTIIALFQKVFQAYMYVAVFLRRKVSENNYFRRATILWCYLLSMYNFSMWVQSFVEELNVHKDGDVKTYYWYEHNELKQTYYAFIIDYRLLFALLFLEHGYAFECEESSNCEETTTAKPDTKFNCKCCSCSWSCSWSFSCPWSWHWSKLSGCQKTALVFALLFFVMQFLNIPYVLNLHKVLFCVIEILGMISEILVIGFSIWFIHLLDKENFVKFRRIDRGFDMMVAMFGSYGAFFWFIKCVHVSVISQKADTDRILIALYAAKFSFRSVSCIVSVFMYMRTNVSFTQNEEFCSHSKVILALCSFPILYVGIFVNSICDNIADGLNNHLQNTDREYATLWIYNFGTPVYLGFILHLVIHYVMLTIKIKKTMTSPQQSSFVLHDIE